MKIHGFASDREYWHHFWQENGKTSDFFEDDTGKTRWLPEWLPASEIRVFRMPNVSERSVQPVISGIEDMIKEIGLGFDVKYFGVDETATQQIEMATDHKGNVNGYNLGKMIIDERWRDPNRGGVQYADVYLMDRNLLDGDEHWGQSVYKFGYMLLALPGERQNSLDFLWNISKHESGHLLGFQHHHGTETMHTNVYTDNKPCVMEWQAATRKVCDVCLEAMRNHWIGAEQKYDTRFLNGDE